LGSWRVTLRERGAESLSEGLADPSGRALTLLEELGSPVDESSRYAGGLQGPQGIRKDEQAELGPMDLVDDQDSLRGVGGQPRTGEVPDLAGQVLREASAANKEALDSLAPLGVTAVGTIPEEQTPGV
jgi:hypothetical protein